MVWNHTNIFTNLVALISQFKPQVSHSFSATTFTVLMQTDSPYCICYQAMEQIFSNFDRCQVWNHCHKLYIGARIPSEVAPLLMKCIILPSQHLHPSVALGCDYLTLIMAIAWSNRDFSKSEAVAVFYICVYAYVTDWITMLSNLCLCSNKWIYDLLSFPSPYSFTLLCVSV